MSQLLVTLGLMLLLFAGAAHAQSSMFSKDKPLSEAAEARAAMEEFAQCVVTRSRGKVLAYLSTFPASAEARKAAVRLVDEGCVPGGWLKFPERVMRSHFYQILYRRAFGAAVPVGIADTPAIDYADGKTGRYGDAEVAMREFADCVVRMEPTHAHALVMSETAADAEKQAFAALMPSFGNCLPKDVAIEFSKTVLKGLVAETLYRLSKAASPAAAGSAI